ncbi:MAG: DUF4097 family beta strand repeat-containing protein [Armatimonadota bacterium]
MKSGLIIAAIFLASVCYAGPGKSILRGLGLPEYPGAKLSSEAVIQAGPLLDKIEDEFGAMLAVTDIRQVGIVNYTVDPNEDVWGFYEGQFSAPKWSVLVHSMDKAGNSTSILSGGQGLLVVNIDSSDRKARRVTFVSVQGTFDPAKLAQIGNSSEKVGSFVKQSLTGIAVGQPISIPPSTSLRVEAKRSKLTASVWNQNTVRVDAPAESAGDLSRDDGSLVLDIEPGLRVDEITLPESVPVEISLLDGSLDIQKGGRPKSLSISSTGAPVDIEALSLLSGEHSVTAVGADVTIGLADVRGGSLGVEVKSGNITLTLPKNASAEVRAEAPSGKVENETGLTPDESGENSLSLRLGDGKASISLRAVNGTVRIRLAD